ncbi:hypothetical protein ABU162_23710 [Paenibacillus thiaminolyticus]
MPQAKPSRKSPIHHRIAVQLAAVQVNAGAFQLTVEDPEDIDLMREQQP